MLTTKHQNTFYDILCLNRYPENNINQTNQRDSQGNNTEWSYLEIPYISERLNHKIVSFTVCIAHGSYTRRWSFSHNTAECTCTREKCPICYTNLCLWKNAIYQITCINCNQLYIGRTIHFLHDCIREHLSNKNSSVKKHISKDHLKGIEIKTIIQENDPTNLRIFYIRNTSYFTYIYDSTWNIFLHPWWCCWSVKAWIFNSS